MSKVKRKTFDSKLDSGDNAEEVLHWNCNKKANRTQLNIYFCAFLQLYSWYMHVVGIYAKSDNVDVFEQYEKLGLVTKYFKMMWRACTTTGGEGEYRNVKIH